MAQCPVYASDRELTAGQLYEFCLSKDDQVNTACRFYILGAYSGISLGITAKKDGSGKYVENTNKDVCPQNLPISKLVSLYLSVARADFMKFPEDREMSADSFFFGIMATSFPCTKMD